MPYMTLVTDSSGKRVTSVNQKRTGKAQDATLAGLPKIGIVEGAVLLSVDSNGTLPCLVLIEYSWTDWLSRRQYGGIN
jgi:hypothetical protein